MTFARLRFFFYGTLLDGSDNAVAREVHRLLKPLGPATISGLLHAIPDPQGWFPALFPGDGDVHGALYEAREGFSQDDLAQLDAYEDYYPRRPADSLYLRQETEAWLRDGKLLGAEAYFYNRPPGEGSQPIPGGSFRQWLADNGHAQFTGLRAAD